MLIIIIMIIDMYNSINNSNKNKNIMDDSYNKYRNKKTLVIISLYFN